MTASSFTFAFGDGDDSDRIPVNPSENSTERAEVEYGSDMYKAQGQPLEDVLNNFLHALIVFSLARLWPSVQRDGSLANRCHATATLRSLHFDTYPLFAYKVPTQLSALPSTLHFETKQLHGRFGAPVTIPQREFYDIKAQLMAETEIPNYIPGISVEDVEPGVYEGGYKTWECAEDLANYLLHHETQFEALGKSMTVIELGAGTALPASMLLQQYVRRSSQEAEADSRELNLVLADYNRSVLEVATIPNLLLTWATSLSSSLIDRSLDLTSFVRVSFLKYLSSHNINISVISGGWSPTLTDLLVSNMRVVDGADVLILASETIYSPTTVRLFTDVLLHLLAAVQRKGGHPTALVAAKKVYFGVGGSLDGFLNILRGCGGQSEIVWQSEDMGVGRVIVKVRRTDA